MHQTFHFPEFTVRTDEDINYLKNFIDVENLERIIIRNMDNFLMNIRMNGDKKPIETHYPVEYGNIVFQFQDGNTLLHFPDYEYEAFNFLLENGADPNVANNEGKTPLHMASVALLSGKKQNLEIIKLLLDYNADPYFTDNGQNTAADTVARLWSFGATFGLPGNNTEILDFWQTHYPRSIKSSNLELTNSPEVAAIKA